MESNSAAAAAALREARRLIVKIGSATLCRRAGGVDTDWLLSLCADLDALRRDKRDVIVVTSGAVALGRSGLGLTGDLRLDEKQAASAVGQARLMNAWQAALDVYGAVAAQILLTLDDTEDRRRYLNARATFRTLLEAGVVPVVNENDTIATAEIRYGDNDRLAAHAAQLAEADLLIILSDIDGVYTADPRINPAARRLDEIAQITPAIEAAAGGANADGGFGSGGMATKIAAAKIAGLSGCATIVAPGAPLHPLRAILNGGPATLIHASASKENARRRWIAGRVRAAGVLTIDEGAVRAIRSGKSLLPAGVVSISGDFAEGDAVTIEGPDGAVIATGLSAYDASEAAKAAGLRSEDIDAALGYRRRPAIVERDDLVLKSKP